MTGLIAPAPGNDPAHAEVLADGWYPPVKLADIRETLRLGDGAVSTSRLIAATEGAMLTAMRDLASWRAARESDGAGELADVTAQTVNAVNMAELLWQRAVRYLAAAELADGHRDLVATEQGNLRAEDKALTADEYRRHGWHALADLMSIGAADPAPRNRVSLV